MARNTYSRVYRDSHYRQTVTYNKKQSEKEARALIDGSSSKRNVSLMESGEHMSSSVAGSAFKFLLIIPLMFALFASLNGGQNVMHFETMLDMLAGAPALDISWIPQITGWTSGMSDIAQKIFGFILKPIEWSMYIITGLSQVLTFIGYIFYYIFAF